MKHLPAERDSILSSSAAPLKRRGLLLGVGVAAVTGAAAVAASRALQASATERVAQAETDTDAQGYRLSQHVLRYYETARI
jgi:hypothetical protein